MVDACILILFAFVGLCVLCVAMCNLFWPSDAIPASTVRALVYDRVMEKLGAICNPSIIADAVASTTFAQCTKPTLDECVRFYVRSVTFRVARNAACVYAIDVYE